jgi:gamma-glutamylaminecyclotransferase
MTARRPPPVAPPRNVDGLARVFVYGTLLRGEINHHHLASAPLLRDAQTPPAFTLHDLGHCPGLVRGGTHVVVGELYAVDEPTLAALDRLEGHPRFYLRTLVDLDAGAAALTYLLRPAQVEGTPIIASGSWRGRRQPPAR